MANLTYQQIAQYAYNAGFRGDGLSTAVAVAMAESSGDPTQLGDVGLENATYGPSVGLWQIRSVNPGYGNATERAQRNAQANLDPSTNATDAYAISRQGTNFQPWSTYTGGAYRRYLPQAQAAAQSVTAAGGSGTGGAGAAGAAAGASAGAASSSTGFRAAPSALTSSSQTVNGQGQQLRTSHDQIGGTTVPAQAFGGVKQSQPAAQAHQSTIDSVLQGLQSLFQRIGTLATGLTSSAGNYQQGDAQAAANFRALMPSGSSTAVPGAAE